MKEIVTLVVHDDKRREILHVNFPNGLHAKFRVFQDFHLPEDQEFEYGLEVLAMKGERGREKQPARR